VIALSLKNFQVGRIAITDFKLASKKEIIPADLNISLQFIDIIQNPNQHLSHEKAHTNLCSAIYFF